jgi:hypothetical protein
MRAYPNLSPLIKAANLDMDKKGYYAKQTFKSNSPSTQKLYYLGIL